VGDAVLLFRVCSTLFPPCPRWWGRWMWKNWSRVARVFFSCRRGFCCERKPTLRSGDRKTAHIKIRWQPT
jgi:hypothetical protein